MMRRAACLLTVLVLCAFSSRAQRTVGDNTRQPRILLLLDGSSSMLQPWNKTIRFKAAANVIAALMDSIYAVNAGVEFGLRVYGHQSPAQNNDCFDSRQEVMFSKNNATQMGLRLASLRPLGVSPIAYSLKEAAENDLVDEVRNAYAVILITDGGESCGGNICDVVKRLIDHKIYFKPYILSLVNYAPLRDQYACLGTYLQVSSEAEIAPAIHKIVEAYRPVLSMPIMAVATEPSRPQPKPNQTVVTIPAWIPDRSSLASLTITITKPAELPAYRTRPAPHRKAVPAPEPVSRPAFEPAAIKPDFLAPLSGTGWRRQLPLSFVGKAPLRLAVPRPAPPRPSIPEPRQPEAVAAIRTGRNVSELRAQRGSRPAPAYLPVPRPAAISKPLPEQIVIVDLALIARRNLPPAYHAYPTPRRIPAPRPDGITRSIPEPELLASIAGIKTAPELTIRRKTPSPHVVSVPPLAAVARPAPIVRPDTATRPAIASTSPKKDTARTSIVIKRIEQPLQPALPKSGKNIPTATKPVDKPKEVAFTTETEDAKETSLAILFTDGRGKFYASTPQLQLLDAATGKLVKQFYRTIDAAGNPDPQTVPPGTYNLLVAGRSNMLMRRIVVEKDKKNKIIVKVSHGTLIFRYENAPDRPITEFDAIVNIRFEPGPTVKQPCTAELEYAPGNYYIEINTMPVSRFNTDIDFGAITEIQIPEPGYVQFINTNPIGVISLYTPLGNKYVRFHGLRITGNPADQKLRLRPGTYEVHWVKNPSAPFATETIERFVVKSNAMTEVELK